MVFIALGYLVVTAGLLAVTWLEAMQRTLGRLFGHGA